MNCIVCGKSADVAIHIEDGDPLVYCHDCRASERPERKHKITSEHRLSRRKSKDMVFEVACKLTSMSCLSIRDEDLAGVDRGVLDAIIKVIEIVESRDAPKPVDRVQHIDTDVPLDRSGPEGFMNWLLIHAIAHHAPKDPDLKAVWDRLRLNDIPVEFKIAGADVPFAKVVYAINGQLDRMIEEKAIELFKARCGGVIEALDQIRDGVNAKARELFPLVDHDRD